MNEVAEKSADPFRGGKIRRQIKRTQFYFLIHEIPGVLIIKGLAEKSADQFSSAEFSAVIEYTINVVYNICYINRYGFPQF